MKIKDYIIPVIIGIAVGALAKWGYDTINRSWGGQENIQYLFNVANSSEGMIDPLDLELQNELFKYFFTINDECEKCPKPPRPCIPIGACLELFPKVDNFLVYPSVFDNGGVFVQDGKKEVGTLGRPEKLAGTEKFFRSKVLLDEGLLSSGGALQLKVINSLTSESMLFPVEIQNLNR